MLSVAELECGDEQRDDGSSQEFRHLEQERYHWQNTRIHGIVPTARSTNSRF